jgi:precorrin-2 dehydrogenase/sirohydrochlorin ferrochelatase
MLDIAGRLAVVVAGGLRSLRIARGLLSHGAEVLVVGTDLPDDLLAMEQEGLLALEPRAYVRGDLDGAFMCIVASGSAVTDAAAAQEARETGVLLHLPADAAGSDFIVPSVVARGLLQVAVSTGGAAPTVAREVRRGIAELYGTDWEDYTRLIAELRVLARERTGLSDADLEPLFSAVAASGVRQLLARGEAPTAAELFERHADAVGKAASKGDSVAST